MEINSNEILVEGFQRISTAYLANAINDWLKSKNVTVIDIKYCCSLADTKNIYSALVIYKINK